MSDIKPNLKPIVICGATASGKSALALQLAQKINGVIINADSQQVYKELPILSAQPSEEEKKLIPHYLYGFISGGQKFDVAQWLAEVKKLLTLLPHPIIIVGGTGLYLNALFYGLSPIPQADPEIRKKVRAMPVEDVVAALGEKADGNPQRMRRALEVKLSTGKHISEWHFADPDHPYKPDDFTILNLNVSRETIYENINTRFARMAETGAVEEVTELQKMQLSPELPIMKAVGVPEISDWLSGNISRKTMIETASQKSRNYAKRQLTWFRNQMPESTINVANFEDAARVISE